ncbi:MAG: hypothetical protein SFV51_06965 [Bryobacteraceae bacterium]|nr:hypothetical protein [Bryobacteraceae bacterium]
MAAASPTGPRPLTQVAPVDAADLDVYIATVHQMLTETATNAALHEEAETLYRQACAIADHGEVSPQLGALKALLRDEAFRFTEQATRTR